MAVVIQAAFTILRRKHAAQETELKCSSITPSTRAKTSHPAGYKANGTEVAA